MNPLRSRVMFGATIVMQARSWNPVLTMESAVIDSIRAYVEPAEFSAWQLVTGIGES